MRMEGLRRAGHLVWEEEGMLLCWGGVKEHRYKKPKGPNRTPTCGNSFHDPAEVVTYCPASQSWGLVRVGGEVPRPLAGAVGVPLGGGLLVWGGLALGEECGYYTNSSSNELHFLSTVGRRWQRLKPEGRGVPASEKAVGWSWSNKAYFFSGWSDNKGEDENAQDFQWEEEDVRGSVNGGGGWHNALTCYCPKSNSWHWPKTKGRPPSPRAAAALAVVGDSAFIFGGRGRRGRMDDLQDLWLLETESLDWEEVELAYDHGELRCLPDLDDHCDGVMHLQLGQARP